MNTLAMIETRLKNTFHPVFLTVDDESDQHIGHAGHQGGGRHFSIIISAAELNGLSRVAAHRKIYAALGELMQRSIHALRIEIR